MARRKTARRPHYGVIIACAVFIALACFFLTLTIKASTLHFKKATVALHDLPPAFEGFKLLYLSDIDIMDASGADTAARLVRRLCESKPDVLILGGDYTSTSLLKALNGEKGLTRQAIENRNAFFNALGDIAIPQGKYALAALSDGEELYQVLSENGFQMLNDSRQKLQRGDDSLWLVGLHQNSENVRKGGRLFRSGECVIAVADTPACFPMLNTVEAEDGGRWVDLCLAGHTHGGQIVLLHRSILDLSSIEYQYLYGWTTETGIPMLTTSGVGCEYVNLRFNTTPEAWLITLTGENHE